MKYLTGLLILCAATLINNPVLSQQPPQSATPPGITILNAKWEAFVNVSSANGPAGSAPDTNPNRLPLPTGNTATAMVRTQLYAYSIELTNNGPRPIKALAWDFIFIDPANQTELLRHSFANLQKIEASQKKTVRFTTQAAPPKLVSAGGLAKDKTSPFAKSATLKCVMFADGSTWEQPNPNGKPCESLERWLERRKKWQPGIEDLPFKP